MGGCFDGPSPERFADVPAFGRALRQFLESEEQVALLARPPFDRCGWVDGGCGVLARALEIWAGGKGSRVVVAGHSIGSLVLYWQAHHEALVWNDWYFDGDGAARQRTWLSRWQRLVANAEVVAPGEAPSEIPEDVHTSHELAVRLQQAFGAWPPV